MPLVTSSILTPIFKPASQSHKGDNGRLLVIAGSEKYHGSLLLAIQVASRVADLVYVLTDETNVPIVQKLKSETAAFIAIERGKLWETIEEKVDAILMGPGISDGKNIRKNIKQILKKYYDKKVVIDATALRMIDPLDLHPNCVVTPHHAEFEALFNCASTPEHALNMAKYYQCVVVLKGQIDYVSDGKEIWENRTGNAGMTKGGTGDVLAGLIAALSCKNPPLLSAQAGAYLNGLAGDRLYKKRGTFYNAEDLVEELGRMWKEEVGGVKECVWGGGGTI